MAQYHFQSATSMCTEYKVLVIILCVSYTWAELGIFTKPHNLDVVEEVQHAVCNISTKDIQTSANASVTRQLKGVCTSKQLDLRLRQLELKIINELEIIKRILSSQTNYNTRSSTTNNIPIFPTNYESYSDPKMNDYDDIDEIHPIFSSFKSTHFKKPNHSDLGARPPILIIDEKPTESTRISARKIEDSPLFLMSKNDKNIISEDIIRELNNTIQITKNGSVFYYFWKIENFNKLMTRFEIYIKSPTMMVHGHELILQFHPNQPKQDYMTIKLKTSYSFQKKHKFVILHRRGLEKDIESPLLGAINNPNVFIIPMKLIHSNGCLKNNSIIVTLTIFLEIN